MFSCGMESLFLLVVFFCKQKTAYEMRISDWSSDVCSSDLIAVIGEALVQRLRLADVNSLRRRQGIVGRRHHALATADLSIQMHQVGLLRVDGIERSEERREGKSVSVRVNLGGRRIINKKKQKDES